MGNSTHHMYFVAILCPEELDKQILDFKNYMKEHYGCVVALRSPAHVTLVPPFWLENSKHEVLLAAHESFEWKDAFEVRLDGFSHFGINVIYVTVLEEPKLYDLKIRTENHFKSIMGDVIKPDDRPFHPHVTIANRDMRRSEFRKAWEKFSRTSFKANFRVNGISVLRHEEGKWQVIKNNNH